MSRRRGSLAVVEAVVAGTLTLLPSSAVAAPAGQAGDFNGDGFADLAVGVPQEDVDGVMNAGIVNVIYGGAAGLSATTPVADQFFSAEACGAPLQAEASYGYAVASGDLNGDGFDDLAMGGKGQDVGGNISAGAVCVLYGTGAGLSAAGSMLWHQDVAGVLGEAEPYDVFGLALAIGDFNADGYGDLAVGVPGEDSAAGADAGAVNVLYGSALGITEAGDDLWDQDAAGVAGTAEAGDAFGSSLAAANLGKGAGADLAVGVPFEDVGSAADAGGVNVLYGGATGLTANGEPFWTQDSPGVGGASEALDRFGFSLAAANFGKGKRADLAVGVPGEDLGVPDAGAVNVLYGSAVGLTSTGDQVWTQDSTGVLDVSEASDLFGYALAAGNVGNGARADLAVGIPGEDLGVANAGAVAVLYGSPGAGLRAANDQFWTAAGLPGPGPTAEADFGWAVRIGGFGNGGPGDLAVGAYLEDVGAAADAGTVRVLYGSAAGLGTGNSQLWHQDVADVEAMSEASDWFGFAL